MNFYEDTRVAVDRLEDYDPEQLEVLLRKQFTALSMGAEQFSGKRVLLKPNLVNKKGPWGATTTHPEMVRAAVRILKGFGAELLIAESPGGIYTPASLEAAYKASCFKEIAEAEGAVFNYDTSARIMKAPSGEICREFNFITPIHEADIIVNLCKLKTHSLTKMTAAVKNFYGAIPGTEKVEMHGRFSYAPDFFRMLVDLTQCICEHKPVLSICDAILAMEGDGPGTGDPRKLYTVISGMNPFAVDLACAELISFGSSVGMLEIAKERGLCPKTAEGLTVIGTSIAELAVHDFKEPQSQKQARQIRMIPGFVKPRPIVDAKVCRGCGICASSCPKKTIALKNGKARINRRNCIRCFCCQEMCPFKAIRVKRSIVFEKILK